MPTLLKNKLHCLNIEQWVKIIHNSGEKRVNARLAREFNCALHKVSNRPVKENLSIKKLSSSQTSLYVKKEKVRLRVFDLKEIYCVYIFLFKSHS